MKKARLDCTEWLANRIALSAFNALASEPGHFLCLRAGLPDCVQLLLRASMMGTIQIPVVALAARPIERSFDQ